MSQETGEGERRRLAALSEYDVLDTPPEEAFDRITRLVRAALGKPIALVSLVDTDRQWFKSVQGLEFRETPRNLAFCAHAVRSGRPLIVEDALRDPRFRDNPLVQSDPHFRFYAGVPLIAPDGQCIGTLCAIDRDPGTASPEQMEILSDLARLVIDQLELRRLAAIDPLTGVLTRRSFERQADKALARAIRDNRDLACVIFDIDHFKAINDSHGHAVGDQALRAVTLLCRRELRSIDLLGRLGGEEFAIVLPGSTIGDAIGAAERLRGLIARSSIGAPSCRLTASFGVTGREPSDRIIDDLMQRADMALYQAKHGGRDQVAQAA